jgi:hypothetical protein
MNTAARIRAGIAIFAVFLFLAININRPSQKDARQLDFESWLQAVDSSPATTELQAHPIQVMLRSDYSEFLADWKLTTLGTPESDTRTLRILQLAREGNLFSLGKAPPPEGAPRISFSVQQDGRAFQAVFSREEIDQNLPAQSLLKLFELYSTNSQVSDTLTQS